MQIVGASCGTCCQRIAAVIDGRLCHLCGAAFHYGCQTNKQTCPVCQSSLLDGDEAEKERRSRDLTQITSGRNLSFRCIRCGSASVEHVKTLHLTYVPRWSWYFIATGVLWLPVYMYLRRTASLTVGLCSKDRRRILSLKFLGYALLVIGPILIFVGVQSDRLVVQLLGAALLVAFLPVVRFATPVVVAHIDGDLITLAEVHNKALQGDVRDARA